MAYEFTNDWFDHGARGAWDQLVPKINPSKILEVGSYEGASACYLIDTMAADHDVEIHCVDTWLGSQERQHDPKEMPHVERRFLANTQLAIGKAKHKVDLHVHKGTSAAELPRLLASGMQGYFDFVYIDGSHQAPDVLLDAVLGFEMLRKGGLLVFDDYLWQEQMPWGADPIRSPKIAIDAFTTIYCRKGKVINAPLGQLYVQKFAG
jgi:predicted O-methyltransferase YrrM